MKPMNQSTLAVMACAALLCMLPDTVWAQPPESPRLLRNETESLFPGADGNEDTNSELPEDDNPESAWDAACIREGDERKYPSFRRYKRIYMVDGPEKINPWEGHLAKFQISFQLVLVECPFIRSSINLGYTQKAFWYLGKSSTPFADNNFNPEIFWKTAVLERNLFVKFGFEHESNGKDDPNSRTWNRTYLESTLLFSYKKIDLRLRLKGWIPSAMEQKDMPDYLGYFEFETALSGSWDHVAWELYGIGRKGARGGFSNGSIEYGLSIGASDLYRNGKSFWSLLPALFVQGFSGHGEYLLVYDKRVNTIRVGLSLTRKAAWTPDDTELRETP